jgi:phosphoserine aminotransferase
MQFAMLPMNYLTKDKSADYVHTGEWSSKAMKEAKRFGSVKVVATSEDKKFSYIPKTLSWSSNAAFAHITTNNTIEGTEFAQIPNTGTVPLVADMSSDFMARDIDHSRFSMIYAGAQKNAGPAGVTIIVMKKSFLDQASEDVPAILSYKTHAKSDSLYNTPPAFAIYTFGLVLKWIEAQGGIVAVEKVNRKKADLIYAALDEHPGVYDPAVIERADRSLMNVTFRLKDASKESEFLKGAEAKGMDGLKGHRSVGGFRASIYNAFPTEGCEALAQYLHDFARRG